VLVDVLGVPTLKGDAIAYVKGLLTGARRLVKGREELLWIAYVGLSTLSVATFIAFNVWIIFSPTPSPSAPGVGRQRFARHRDVASPFGAAPLAGRRGAGPARRR